VIGIIFNPITDQLYTAITGQGAFLNGHPIKVSGQTGKFINQLFVKIEKIEISFRIPIYLEPKKSLVLYDVVFNNDEDMDTKRIRNITKLMGNIQGLA